MKGCGSRAPQGTFPSSATPRTISSPIPTRLRDDAVRAVGSDHIRSGDPRATDDRGHRIVRDLHSFDARSVTELGARSGGLLGEERVQAAALGHEDQRLLRAARESSPVPEPEDHAVDDVLHDRSHVARRVPERASGQPAAARLVAREPRTVGKQDARAGAGKPDRGRGSGGTRTHHKHVETLHSAILVTRRSAATMPRSRRGSRVAKGGGL